MTKFQRTFSFFMLLPSIITFFTGGGVYRKAHAQGALVQSERILSFNSDISVNSDASLDVVETITVYATGSEIKHGIYRDFPTKYTDRYGNAYKVTFDVTSTARNNAPEPYHTANLANGVRVYMGDANVLVPTGEHTYVLRYHTTRQLGFFTDHDELYWNVTGNGWNFIIEKASATVHLPSTVPQGAKVSIDGYTGPQGATAKNFTPSSAENGYAFATSGALNPKEGLTIVVGWPKGYVPEPTTFNKLWWLLLDNRGILLQLMLLAVLFVYYIFIWKKRGKDPEKGTVIPQYEAPENLSAAAIRYVSKMRTDNTALTATIISLAEKGFISITQIESTYILTKKEKIPEHLPQEEAAVYNSLFKDKNELALAKSEYKILQAATKNMGSVLELQYKKQNFTLNGAYQALGIVLGLGVILLPLILVPGTKGILYAALDVVTVAAMAFFTKILPRRTPSGRLLQDKIEGFKLFLSVTEKDRLNFHNPPEQTPTLFEKFLPFALALGVEQKWGEQFSKVFTQMAEEGRPYSPVWYMGPGFNPSHAADFAGSFGSEFATVVSASSTPPGSSSGFGGGGGSGGGGGGGGGGGW